MAASTLALVGCQREEIVGPEVLSGKDGIVKFAPGVGGIVSNVKSSASEDASATTYTQPLTLMSEDGGFTLPLDLSVTSLETGDGTKATLINENGGINDAEFATATDNTFWVAAWNDATTPAQIIPDASAKVFPGDYVVGGENGWYQKVMYRDGASSSKYWMTVQPYTPAGGSETIADDEYIWKKAETKTFYAYANVPSGATMAQLSNAGGQTMTLSALPDKDVLMGYYAGNGSTGSPAMQTGTASIQFHHPFAAVKVKKGTVAEGVTITGVAIENVYGKGGEVDGGKLMVKQEENTFTWTRADGDSFKDENLVESISVTCDGEAALVLPQTFPSKARIRVTLQQGGKTFNVYHLLSDTWIAGTLYTYTVGYAPELPPYGLTNLTYNNGGTL